MKWRLIHPYLEAQKSTYIISLILGKFIAGNMSYCWNQESSLLVAFYVPVEKNEMHFVF